MKTAAERLEYEFPISKIQQTLGSKNLRFRRDEHGTIVAIEVNDDAVILAEGVVALLDASARK